MEDIYDDKCSCEEGQSKAEYNDDQMSSSASSLSASKDKKRMCLTALTFNLKRVRASHLNSKRSKKCCADSKHDISLKKSPKWTLKFSCTKREPKSVAVDSSSSSCCKCTCYRPRSEQNDVITPIKNNEEVLLSTQSAVLDSNEEQMNVVAKCESVTDENDVDEAAGSAPVESSSQSDAVASSSSAAAAAAEPVQIVQQQVTPIIRELNITSGGNSIYECNRGPLPHPCIQLLGVSHEDCDEAARRQRAKEIEQGVEPPANFKAVKRVQLLCPDMEAETNPPRRLQIMCSSDLPVESLRALFQNHVTLRSCPLDAVPCHTQIDFIHCLVPDLLHITNCSFYWGKMDRYEAERLLDGKPEGTFLLRDSAQEEFLFSVSFRRYGRSLHARIEQWNHKFSFDSHDPGVFTSETVCGLIEHHKDPSSCMFFEPMLTWPLHRNFTFSLQHLCRAVITSRITYDDVNQLQLPKTLKSYLKEYHYRQKVRVKRFDDDIQWLDFRNQSN